MTKLPLPPRLSQPLALRIKDETWPARTVLTGRDDYLDVPRVSDEMRARFGLLWEHYGIDPSSGDAWKLLAVSLALDHVPGLRLTKPGRKKGSEDLMARFDEERRSSKRRAPSDMAIAGKIAKQDGKEGSTVLRRYHEQKAEAEQRASRRMTPKEELRLVREMSIQLSSQK